MPCPFDREFRAILLRWELDDEPIEKADMGVLGEIYDIGVAKQYRECPFRNNNKENEDVNGIPDRK